MLKVLIGILFVLIFASSVSAASVTLVWDPSPSQDVTGYKIYYGTSSRSYTNVIVVGNVLTATITGLVEGTKYYFAATAYNVLGWESDYSAEVSYTVPLSEVYVDGVLYYGDNMPPPPPIGGGTQLPAEHIKFYFSYDNSNVPAGYTYVFQMIGTDNLALPQAQWPVVGEAVCLDPVVTGSIVQRWCFVPINKNYPYKFFASKLVVTPIPPPAA